MVNRRKADLRELTVTEKDTQCVWFCFLNRAYTFICFLHRVLAYCF